MALTFECAKCHTELERPGAIVLSPPDEYGRCTKYHICTDCFSDILAEIRGQHVNDEHRTAQLETALSSLLDAGFHADRAMDKARGLAQEVIHPPKKR